MDFTLFSREWFIQKAQDDRIANYRAPEKEVAVKVERRFHGPFQIQNFNCRWAQFDIDPCFNCVACQKEFYD